MSRILHRLISGFGQERTRRFGLKTAALAYHFARLPPFCRDMPLLPAEVMGLQFPNPVGLAAGLDRTGELYPHLASSGFGFMELGTIKVGTPGETLKAVAMLPDSDIFARTCPEKRPLLGISLGSMRNRLDAKTQEEYLLGLRALHGHADYITLNLSRPGSAVRSGDAPKIQLAAFLDSMGQAHRQLTPKHGSPVPLVVKTVILEDRGQAIPLLLQLGKEAGLDGVIAAFENWISIDEMHRRIERMARYLEPIPLIAVGGIGTAEDARRRMEAGAALVQLYHAFLERGPFVARSIVDGLLDLPPLKR